MVTNTNEAEKSAVDSVHAKSGKIYGSVEERRAVVEESLRPGIRVVDVARSHGIKASQIYQWRKLARQGRLGEGAQQEAQLIPVAVVGGAVHGGRMAQHEARQPNLSGAIQIQLPRAEVRVEGSVDASSLRVVLECLRA